MRETTAGMTTLAATSVTPSTCIVVRIVAASTTISSASMRATFSPDALATSGSKVVKSSGRYCRKMTATAPTPTAATTSTSVELTPRMLPKSAASKLRPLRPKSANSASPSAKEAVVMTPMAASAPIRRPRVTALIISAEATPQMPAPRK